MEQQSRPSYVVRPSKALQEICILIVHSEPYLLKNISPVGAESVMISLFNCPQSSNSSFSNQIIVCVSFRVARCFEL